MSTTTLIDKHGSLAELALGHDVELSYEFFPPKSEKMEETLWKTVRRLEPLMPKFVSVTYGAGGSTREKTHEIVQKIQDDTQLDAAAHLTCVGHTKEEIKDIADTYWEGGIKHIVALRGDLPQGEANYSHKDSGYPYAVDLIKGLKELHDFEISVAAYPETHPEAPSADYDLDNLKAKQDAGADRAITQYFFDVDVFLRFYEKAQAKGITMPIVPGLLPVSNFKQVVNFSGMCGTSVPAWMAKLFEGLDDDAETRKLLAATVAAEQVKRLRAAGFTDFHFYTLNRADLCYSISHLLGKRPHFAAEQA